MYKFLVFKFNPKPLIIGAFLMFFFSMGYIIPKNRAADSQITLPIIMYHQVLKDSVLHGTYVISPEELENDIKYIKSKGYNFVTVSDLVSYVYNNIPLPPKPIILTFDDGFATGYSYVYPILEKYGAKAVISAITIHSEIYSLTEDKHLSYAHLTWDEMKALSDSGIVEIANHTYNMHSTEDRKGIKIKDGENPDEYKNLLSLDISKAQEQIKSATGKAPVTFTYPFGYSCPEAEDFIRNTGFKASLFCTEGINIITKDKNCLYNLKRYNRPHNIDRYTFFKQMGI
ncbi:MAG: polysaccharide deacetylase family protein [Clostridia bacterium]|nr:polysaccharide deacetylase family protein [Clostridia bacterium]